MKTQKNSTLTTKTQRILSTVISMKTKTKNTEMMVKSTLRHTKNGKKNTPNQKNQMTSMTRRVLKTKKD